MHVASKLVAKQQTRLSPLQYFAQIAIGYSNVSNLGQRSSMQLLRNNDKTIYTIAYNYIINTLAYTLLKFIKCNCWLGNCKHFLF